MAMLRLTEIIGNTDDDAELDRLRREWAQSGTLEYVRLDIWTAQRSRLRATTDHGNELGIGLERGGGLRDGDVLFFDEAARRMIVVEVEKRQVLVCEVAPGEDATATAQIALELGHALGNQHWPIRAQGLRVYVPVVADTAIMEAMLRARQLPGVSWHFQDAEPEMNLPLTAPSHEPLEHSHSHHGGHA